MQTLCRRNSNLGLQRQNGLCLSLPNKQTCTQYLECWGLGNTRRPSEKWLVEGTTCNIHLTPMFRLKKLLVTPRREALILDAATNVRWDDFDLDAFSTWLPRCSHTAFLAQNYSLAANEGTSNFVSLNSNSLWTDLNMVKMLV